MSFIGNILNKLGVSGQKGESVLGIDMGSSAIKIVQARNEKGVAILETYGELALGPYAGKEVGESVQLSAEIQSEALKDLLGEADVTTQNCGLSIPYSSSLVSFIEVPKVRDKELSQMIPIEARKYVPVPISEVMLDWFIIPEEPYEEKKAKKGRDKTKVMLVAIHNDNLQEYQQIMKNIGLSPSFYEIEAFSTVRAVIDQGVRPVMIMDIGTTLTKLYVVEQGVVKYAHSIGKGGQDMTQSLSRSLSITKAEAEEMKRESGLNNEESNKGMGGRYVGVTLNYILNETNKALIKYQKDNNKNVSSVILTGGGALLEGFTEKAKENLDADVSIANPFSKLQSPAFLEGTLKEAGAEFSVAIGVVLRKLQEM